MNKYICIRACYWELQAWAVGDQIERAKDVKVPEHFKPLTEEAVKEAHPDVPEDEQPPADGSEGSSTRENLKALCGRHGITVKANTTLSYMRTALAEKGITVT